MVFTDQARASGDQARAAVSGFGGSFDGQRLDGVLNDGWA